MRDVYESIHHHCNQAVRRGQTVQQQFKEELFRTFDENGLAESLETFATRCDRVRALFLAGDPIDDLPESATLARLTIDYYLGVKSDRARVAEVETALLFLAQFARYKALGIIARLSGRITSALRYENSAEACYRRLAPEWQW